MSQLTPGRRRTEQKHAKYNPDPKNVGTRTGSAMPTDVPRLSMGFEDPTAFFRSPPSAPDTVKSTYSRRDGGGGGTPGTATTNRTAQTSKRGRMSDLDIDDNDVGGFGDDLLVDDEFEDAMSTPFFKSKPSSALPLPAKSPLPPRTPGATYSSLPSPSSANSRTYSRASGKKASTIGVGYKPSAGGSPVSRRDTYASQATTGLGEEEDVELDENLALDSGISPDQEEEEEGEVEQEEEEEIGKKGKTPKGKKQTSSPVRRRSDPDEDDADMPQEEEEEEESAELGRRQTISKGRLSTRSQRSRMGDEETDAGVGDTTIGSLGGRSLYLGGEDDVGLDDVQQDYDDDGDVGMEQDAVDAEEGSHVDDQEEGQDEEEEEGEEEARPRKEKTNKSKVVGKRARIDGSPVRTKPGTGGRSKRGPDGKVEKKRTRISQIGGDSNGVEGNFTTRRSGRQHMAPLAFWRNEKVEYKRGVNSAEIKTVVTVPTEDVIPFSAKRRMAARSRKGSSMRRSRSVSQQVKGEMIRHAEAGWDDETQPLGTVMDFVTNQEIERRVAYPARMLAPKLIEGEGRFRYQKVFGDDTYMAAGTLEIPVGGFKPEKSAKDNTYAFFIVQGAVEMRVHNTTFVLAPGAQALVPRGNKYSIANISQVDAILWFSQARKTRMTEEEEEAHQSQLSQSLTASQRKKDRVGTSDGTPVGRKRGLKIVPEEEEEEGSEEEEKETPKVTKKKVRAR